MPVRSQSVADRKLSINEPEPRGHKSAQPILKRNGTESKQPPSTPLSTIRRRKQRKRSVFSASLSESPSEHDDLPPPPKPAWEQFSEHIKTFSVMGATYTTSDVNSQDAVVNGTGSDICKKILKDMKDQLEKKRAKELLLLQKQQEAEASADHVEVEMSSDDSDYDSDSDDEAREEKRLKKLRLEAVRYWGIIRRDVQEKIRIRKEKNPAGGTWNALRSQLRALTRSNNVRQELYEKYGIIPRPGTKVAEDSMKPKLSVDVREVVNRFQSFQVRKLKVTFA